MIQYEKNYSEYIIPFLSKTLDKFLTTGVKVFVKCTYGKQKPTSLFWSRYDILYLFGGTRGHTNIKVTYGYPDEVGLQDLAFK